MKLEHRQIFRQPKNLLSERINKQRNTNGREENGIYREENSISWQKHKNQEKKLFYNIRLFFPVC